jgi:hypothetical protein
MMQQFCALYEKENDRLGKGNNGGEMGLKVAQL